jgi:hypothetical protein
MRLAHLKEQDSAEIEVRLESNVGWWPKQKLKHLGVKKKQD